MLTPTAAHAVDISEESQPCNPPCKRMACNRLGCIRGFLFELHRCPALVHRALGYLATESQPNPNHEEFDSGSSAPLHPSDHGLCPVYVDCGCGTRSDGGLDHLPFLRGHARPHGPHECGVWQRPSKPPCERAWWCIQQRVQQFMERVGHQPCVLACVPRLGGRHVRHDWFDGASIHFRHCGCCGSFHCGGQRSANHTVLLDARCDQSGKHHPHRRILVRVEHGSERPPGCKPSGVDHAGHHIWRHLRPNELSSVSAWCRGRPTTSQH